MSGCVCVGFVMSVYVCVCVYVGFVTSGCGCMCVGMGVCVCVWVRGCGCVGMGVCVWVCVWVGVFPPSIITKAFNASVSQFLVTVLSA